MSYFNMVCDSCGREVYGCNIVNGMKFCAKCYQETFGNQQNKESSELLVNSLAEKDQQIAELQKQLEEKEKEIEDLKRKVNCYVDYVENTDMRIKLDSFIVKELQDKLKSQPAEIVEKIRKELGLKLKYKLNDEVSVLRICNQINEVLDTILKEYQK